MSHKTRSLACAALIVLAGALTYGNSLSGPLLFDDHSAIVRNPQIRHLWPLVEALAAPRDNELASRPLVNFSFAVNYAIGGLAVRGYHLVNVALHVLSALVLFGIIRLTFATPKLRERFGTASDGIAVVSALIWMVHPLQTESVDYLTQRTELMMGLFYLLTLYCAIRAALSPAPNHWRMAAILCCLLGMGCKESMATAPVMVALYDRVFLFDSMQDAWRDRKGLYAGLALAWCALAALLMTSLPPTVGFGSRVSGWTYLMNQFPMILRYLRLTVWPHALVVDYGLPKQVALLDVLPQAAAIAALVLLTGVALVRKPMIGFLGACFFITLAPASSIVPIMTEVGAERRMYLPLAALAVLAVTGGWRLLRAIAGSRAVPAAVAAASLAIVALASATLARNRDYASATTLLQTTVDRWPHGRSQFNLAGALKDEKRIDEAVAHLRTAVPEQPRALLELGSIAYDRGQFAEAVKELREFVRRVSGRPGTTYQRVLAQNLIALSLAQQRKLPEAVEEFQAALTIDPDNADLHGNLAFILLQQRNFDGARRHYEAYLAREKGSAFVLTNLGIALQELGRADEARARFREALAINPNDREARRRLDSTAFP
jgi:protein O-mannosyl-transferase